MQIGLNLIYLVPGETGGMEVMARELIPELVRARPDARFTAFVNFHAAADQDAPWNTHLRAVTVPVDARRRTEWVRGEQMLLPRIAAREGVELVHSLASTAPIHGPFRRVVTIHDLIYRLYPDAHAGVLSWGMRALVRLAALRSDRLIAVSRSTRDDLVRYLKVRPDRIDVVPHGVGVTAGEAATSESVLRERLELGSRPVVLSVSAKRPHKNLIALLNAVAGLPTEARPVLLLPGYPTWHEAELRRHVEQAGMSNDVRFLGWIPDADLEGLYALADCFVFPSLYEGFGLPVLEAMQRGVPVACSNTTSLPEVAGDAALLFNPNSTAEIRRSIARLLEDRELAADLARRGRERAASFSWARAAEATIASYERALAGVPSPT